MYVYKATNVMLKHAIVLLDRNLGSVEVNLKTRSHPVVKDMHSYFGRTNTLLCKKEIRRCSVL
jgi:hypothetical protein